MKYSIVPLQTNHLEDAARLVSRRYTGLRKQFPLLPEQYASVDVLLPMLAEALAAGQGTAAILKGKLAGFLTGYRLPDFLGSPSAFSPEWANGADLQDSRRIYAELYTFQAAQWVEAGFPSHLVSMLVNDQAGIQGWHWLGFGMVAADGIRSLEPVPAQPSVHSIRQATLRDAETIMALDKALLQHLAGSPTYFPHGASRDLKFYENWLQDPRMAFWLALQRGEPVAYMGFGPASQEACTIIVDDGTSSIPGAFTSRTVRGAGIASALLNHGLEWALQSGYVRSAVDFEPANPLAARFWLRHYQLVCITLMRRI